ncbi:MAG: ComEC/Rec2 family competence protein [Bryobacterales bacterium]|nr:ComEC/Rec2 family competence protein [Bryobacterales bacterium]
MRHPLLVPAVSLAAGIAAGRLVEFGSRELAVYVCACLALALVSRLRRSAWLARTGVWLAVLFAGLLVERLHRPGPAPRIDAEPRERLILAGCVVEPPALFPNREQFLLELEPGARVRVNLYPRPEQAPPVLRYGQRVELEARIRFPRNFGNPGAFDYVRYLARQEVYWTASAGASSDPRILPGRCGSRLGALVYGVRDAALERLERLYAGDPYKTGMMQAILVGEKSKVEESWTDPYRLTGTYHALVISGMHLTALVGIILLVLRLFPAGEILPLAAATCTAWAYSLVTGWQTPVVRASAGLTLYLAARYLYRRPRLLNLIAAVAIGFLVLDPEQLFDASFQLSFLCVTAIAALAVPVLEKTSAPYIRGLRALEDRSRDPHLPPVSSAFRVELRLLAETISLWLRIPERRVLRAGTPLLRAGFYLWELAVVSAAVQAGLALPMAVYFHRLSFSGLSANMAVVPLLSLTVPAGFLGVFTGWRPAAALAGWLLDASRTVVEWHAGWEPAWRIPQPPLWLGVWFAASLVLAAVVRRGRAAAAVSAAVCLVLLVWHPFPPQVRPGALEVTAIDVGQGDSLFIALPDGRLMLLDAGGFPSYSGRRSGIDTGEDIVSPYLWTRSIKRLDVVAVSHLHEDHAGGVPSVLRNFRPKEVWTGPLPETPEALRLQEAVRATGARLRIWNEGARSDYGAVEIEALAPPAGEGIPAGNGDRGSLVLRLRHGRRSFLLTGDMDPRIEQDLAERGRFAECDVLKVPHHGSRYSTREPMLSQAHPAFALISVGYANPYNHPHPETLARLEQWGARPLRTDLLGLVSVRTDGRRLQVSTGPSGRVFR